MTKLLSAWIPEAAACRLIGLDAALVSKRAAKGIYGATQRTPGGSLLIHIRGLELAARRPFRIDDIQAALAGEPMPKSLQLEEQFTSRRRRTIEEIGAAVARAPDQIEGD